MNDSIRNRLWQDPAWAAYAIGDLGPSFAPHCEWLTQDGELALILRAFDVPVLWAMGAGFAGALERLAEEPRVSLTIRQEAEPELAGHFDTSSLRLMWRMHLRSFQPAPTTGTVRLGTDDLAAIQKLYTGDEAPDFFYPGMLAEGIFHGIREGPELAAVAGTHLVEWTEGVAAIGNVFTRPDRRGRGLASAVTSAVVSEALARGIRLAVLNVRDGNAAAMRVYERLGFAVHCPFLEGVVSRKQ